MLDLLPALVIPALVIDKVYSGVFSSDRIIKIRVSRWQA